MSEETIVENLADSDEAIADRASESADDFVSSNDMKAELGLGISQFHNYRKHLRINCYKRGKNAFFSKEQAEAMRSLYSYVQNGGRFTDYPRPDPSGPGEWEEETDGGLVYGGSQPPSPRTGGEQNSGYVTGIDPNRLKAKATAIAKENLIADMLATQLAENPHFLSEEDRAEIDSYRSHFEAAFPKKEYSPQDITALVIPLPVSEEEGEEAELFA